MHCTYEHQDLTLEKQLGVLHLTGHETCHRMVRHLGLMCDQYTICPIEVDLGELLAERVAAPTAKA